MKIKCEYSEEELEVGKIKPCPFCGETEHLIITDPERYGNLVEEHGSSVIVLECKKCDMEMRQHGIPGNNYMMGTGMLIERWNHRA